MIVPDCRSLSTNSCKKKQSQHESHPKKSTKRFYVNINKRNPTKLSSMPKAKEKQQTIDEVLNSLQPPQKDTVQQLRSLIKDTVPQTTELVKQGRIVYKLAEKDFVWIDPFSDHVDLEFAMGASLSSELLKTRGVAEKSQLVRHASVGNFGRDKAELTRLLRDAAALGFEHCKTK